MTTATAGAVGLPQEGEAERLPDVARQVMLVRVGGERLGLVVEEVAAVLEQAWLSAIPKAPPGILGIMNHVGAVLTVVSLAALLGLPEAAGGQPPFVVVVDRNGDRIGLRVDRVDGITLTVDLARDVRGEPAEPLTRGWLSYEEGEVRLLDGAGVVGEVMSRFERRDRRA